MDSTKLGFPSISIVDDGAQIGLQEPVANVLFLGEPAAVFVTRFFHEVAAQSDKVASGGAARFKDRWDRILGRLESYVRTQSDCNFLTYWLADFEKAQERLPLDAAYAAACRSLSDRFSFVGIAERMAESIFVMFDKFGWKHAPGFSAADNIDPTGFAPTLSELPLRLRRRLESVTARDRALYELAREAFEERFEEAEFSASSLGSYRRQPAFVSENEYRLNYARLATETMNLRSEFKCYADAVQKVVDGLESRYERSQTAYENLLREHLIATGVLAPSIER